jgi:hypothetical protein
MTVPGAKVAARLLRPARMASTAGELSVGPGRFAGAGTNVSRVPVGTTGTYPQGARTRRSEGLAEDARPGGTNTRIVTTTVFAPGKIGDPR